MCAFALDSIICNRDYSSTRFFENNPLHTGPSFTTASFCPPVWRVGSVYERNITWSDDVQQHTAHWREEYSFAIHWSIMAMLGDNTGRQHSVVSIYTQRGNDT